MGKKTKKRPTQQNPQLQQQQQQQTPLDPQVAFAEAQQAVDAFQMEQAAKLLTDLLKVQPQHIPAMELMASVQMELGNPEIAFQVLMRAQQLQPDQGADKYLLLAQLCAGRDSLQCYAKAVQLLEVDLSQLSEGQNDLKRKISSANIAAAELYMTDLCFEPEAEEQCGQFIQLAQQWDSNNPEVFQTLCSYRISQQNIPDAKAALEHSLQLWWPKMQQRFVEQPVLQIQSDDSERSGVDLDSIPTYDFRVTTAKLLIELEEYERSCEILSSLLDEDDEVVQVWYLLGWAQHLRQDNTSALINLQHAKQLYHRVQCDDDGILTHINELLAELPSEAGVVDNDSGNDDEYDDVDDEDGDDMEE